MRKKYISVEIETIMFECEEVIRTSTYQDPQDHIIFEDRFE